MPAEAPIDRPSIVFVVGADRSGTTLMASLLGSHPSVFVHLEAQFVISEIRQLSSGGHQTLTTSEASLQRLEDSVRYRHWDLQLAESTRSAAMQGMDFADFTRLLVQQAASEQGKPELSQWVDHTPSNVRRVATLKRVFPEAKFVHMVRDGRGVASSLLSVDWGPTHVVDAAKFWIERIGQGVAAEARFGPQVVHRVTFEDLVMDPDAVLGGLATFLELEPSGFDIAGDRKVPHSSTRGEHALVGSKPDPKRLTAWQDHLTDREVELFEFTAADLLENLSYEPLYGAQARRPTRSERVGLAVRSAVGEPTNRLRFVGRMRDAAASADSRTKQR